MNQNETGGEIMEIFETIVNKISDLLSFIFKMVVAAINIDNLGE